MSVMLTEMVRTPAGTTFAGRSISLVVTVLNEEATSSRRSVPSSAPSLRFRTEEVIVVNDGSRDRTAEIVSSQPQRIRGFAHIATRATWAPAEGTASASSWRRTSAVVSGRKQLDVCDAHRSRTVQLQ
jgi:cellulose synthase/poly-beta-1,6-N-acetylglucosamine synthase-like glycosyltransferase